MEDVNIVSLDPNYVNELNFIYDSKEELDNEDFTEYSYIVGTHHDYKKIHTIPELKCNDIYNSNEKQKRKLFANKNERTKEQTKIKRMLGQNYTGYHREGKSVFYNTVREKNNIKTCLYFNILCNFKEPTLQSIQRKRKKIDV